MYRHVTSKNFSTASEEYGYQHQRLWNDYAAKTRDQSKKAQAVAFPGRNHVVKNVVVQTPTAISGARSVPIVKQIFANGSVVDVHFNTLSDFHLWQERQCVYNGNH